MATRQAGALVIALSPGAAAGCTLRKAAVQTRLNAHAPQRICLAAVAGMPHDRPTCACCQCGAESVPMLPAELVRASGDTATPLRIAAIRRLGVRWVMHPAYRSTRVEPTTPGLPPGPR